MKQKIKNLIYVSFIVVTFGCVTAVKKPSNNVIQNKSGAMSLKIGFPIYLPLVPDRFATKVYILKVSKDKKSFADMELIESTFENRDQVTFLNLEPGEYAIAGFYRRNETSNQTADLYIVLDDTSIEKSKFRVKEKEVTIPGIVYCMIAEDALNLQGNQLLLSKKIAPGIENNTAEVVLTTLVGGHTRQVRIEKITKVKNSQEEIDSFKPTLREIFEGTSWHQYFTNL
ncbi:hypothetical protein EHR04_02230 [Leptospira levettii]|uniref:Lipoprotein n=1 Tax=Leptospira levettii TaxID=2023178 RepID=A0A5R2BND8_9LEPT|nr:hypothetical protein [Leptospira levettii]PKA26895.1 hypothetical protein CH381_07815 [Leptospira sp. mixed culture ATI2-C-A1]MCW7466549.1 hypothetical protein [Leptospira levettii]MCW7511885.1 hypothetical protein [Leptospira levettii]MCW7515645.1 hypothetical protein [Leptospira levettii]TGM28256.1 hypothetical protein EHQ74_02415 [Leptospira levettii]